MRSSNEEKECSARGTRAINKTLLILFMFCETNLFVVCTETLSVGFGRLLTMVYK